MRLASISIVKRLVKVLPFYLLTFLLLTSCSKDDAAEEYKDWQKRNDAFFASLEDSLARGEGQWMKFQSYSKDGKFIYAKVVTTGLETTETVSPMYNDSVLVSYEGRLMPTAIPLTGKGFRDGKVFDTTIYRTYDIRTNAMAHMKVAGTVNGFATALMRMHRGDTWLVYIPYSLGYGASEQSSVPAYSTLIFMITLYDFAAEGVALPKK